jgi:hypothetical protein
MAIPQVLPVRLAGRVIGSWLPCASAPGKLDLLEARGSFPMKEKVQPHIRRAISTLCDEWSLCHSAKMNISLQ